MNQEVKFQNTTKIEEIAKELKKLIEDFEFQLYIGKDEAIDELEKQIKGFNELIIEIKNKMDITDFINSDKAKEINNNLQELQTQLNSSKAETINKLIEEIEDIDQAIRNIEQLMESEKFNIKNEFYGFSKNFNNRSSRLKSIIEVIKLQYTLGKSELENYIQESKKLIEKRINILGQKLDNHTEPNEIIWAELKKEVMNIFKYLKDEINNLK